MSLYINSDIIIILMTLMTEKLAKEFNCEICNYKCYKNSDFQKHLSTKKHNQKFNDLLNYDSDNEINNKKVYTCQCGKIYKYRQGLSFHRKTCELKKEESQEEEEEEQQLTNKSQNLIDSNLLAEVLKQNQDFQKEMFNQMMEFMKTTNLNTTNNINNGNINTNNNQFNLQFFLNETCKNAMTIDQFLEYLQPTLQELEDTARLGYVEGITRIIMRGLKDLEEELRPFHCSDLKRESLFVKNPDGEWEKETDEKTLMLKFVKAVAKKNFNNVNEWRKLHPNCGYYDSKSNDMFNQIMLNSTSGRTEEEQKSNYNKIIKNITKEIVIDKKAHRNNNK
jgi:hypothetical protein